MRFLSVGNIIQLSFGVIAVITFLSVDFVVKKSRAEGPYGIGTYVSDIAGKVRFRSGDEPRALTVAEMFPDAPEGWERRVFAKTDLELVTGAPAPEAQKGPMPGAASLLAVAALTQGPLSTTHRTESRTYQRGEDVVLMKIGYMKDATYAWVGADVMAAVEQADALFERAEFFASVEGLVFRQDETPAYGTARRITAKMGPQIQVELVTAAPDAAVLEVLEGLDVAALNAMLVEPIAGLGTGGVTQDLPAELREAALEGGDPADAGAAPARGWLTSIFSGKSAGGGEAPKVAMRPVEPITFTCSMDRGFKRCSAGD